MAERNSLDHPLKNKQVALTGATGLLGSELIRQLAETGTIVRMVVRNISRVNAELLSLAEQSGWSLYETELVNPVDLREAFAGMDVVFHCAARVNLSTEEDRELIRVNTEITHHVVNACLETGVRRLMHVSSIAALGEANEQGVIRADSYPDSVAGWSPYALSKFYSENEVWRGVRYGLQATVVNPSVILGPGDWKGGGSPMLFAALSSGVPFYVPGSNGYVDVRDAAEALIRLCTEARAINRRFVLNGANVSFRDFMTLAARSVGRKAPRWSMGRKELLFLRHLSLVLAKLTRSNPLLSQGLIHAALSTNRYDGEAVKEVIDFHYRPFEETVRFLARKYLEEKRNKK
ncbi:MAG: NAD-dependent epimerase/dehydratase family protein [Rikenellaceae bacterium]|nr:NAD-dependent epimerase/dehydratase family protein [Rikenellaceae bacterium]